MSSPEPSPALIQRSPRRGVRGQRGVQFPQRLSELRAISLAECCRRLGITVRTGHRLLATGEFPIAALPRLTQKARLRFSEVDLLGYLLGLSPSEVLRALRGRP